VFKAIRYYMMNFMNAIFDWEWNHIALKWEDINAKWDELGD